MNEIERTITTEVERNNATEIEMAEVDPVDKH